MKEPRPDVWHGGSVAPGLETVNENGVKWCTSGVRDLWDFSGVGQVLRCLGVGPLDLSKSLWNGMEGKEDVSGTGERVLRLVKLEKKSNQVNAKYIHINFYRYGAMLFSAFYLDLVI